MAFAHQIQSKFRRSGAPVTIAIMVAMCVVSILAFFVPAFGSEVIAALSIQGSPMLRPWTFVTYPIAYAGLGAGLGILFFALMMMWTYFIGSIVERDLDSIRYLAFWCAVTLLGSISMTAGYAILGHLNATFLSGPALPLAALLVAWATRYPDSIVMLFMIIPVKAKWLGWLTAGGTLFGYGSINPFLGLFAIVPVAFSYAFASNRFKAMPYSQRLYSRVQSKAEKKREQAYFDDVHKREKERQERERLRKLFEDSLDE